MPAITRRSLGALTAASALGLLATACGSAGTDQAGSGSDAGGAKTRQVQDNFGTQTVPVAPRSVVATDNRSFETLHAWGVKLSAAPQKIVAKTSPYKTDKSIVDLGNHREPNLEAVVAAKPDLIINGQRFASHREKLMQLAPNAAIVELDPRDGKPFDEELKRQVTVLGEVFGKQAEAKKLADDLDAAIARAKKAYDPAQKVMAVTTTGGEIGFIAPKIGRALGPVYDMLGLTPALEVQGASDDHQGDDISVEAIADANPDWILVMDRDAAVAADDPGYKPAATILESAQPLQKVTAIAQKQVVYMPEDTYQNEGIQTYTEFLNELADAFEGKKA